MECVSFGLNDEFTSSVISPAVVFVINSTRLKASQFLLDDFFFLFSLMQLRVNPEQISVSDLLHMYYVIWIASGTWFQT